MTSTDSTPRSRQTASACSPANGAPSPSAIDAGRPATERARPASPSCSAGESSGSTATTRAVDARPRSRRRARRRRPATTIVSTPGTSSSISSPTVPCAGLARAGRRTGARASCRSPPASSASRSNASAGPRRLEVDGGAVAAGRRDLLLARAAPHDDERVDPLRGRAPRRAPARGCRPRSRSRRAPSPRASASRACEHAARLERARLLEELRLQEDTVAERPRAEGRRAVEPAGDRARGPAATSSRVTVMRPRTLPTRGPALGEGVLGPGAALGRGQAAALGGDRAALDAVRRRHLDLDGAVAVAARRPRRPAPGTCASTAPRASRGTCRWMRMWFGWSSRVRLPDAKTDESLSKVSFPSGAG